LRVNPHPFQKLETTFPTYKKRSFPS
jgi:hypothetical protein